MKETEEEEEWTLKGLIRGSHHSSQMIDVEVFFLQKKYGVPEWS